MKTILFILVILILVYILITIESYQLPLSSVLNTSPLPSITIDRKVKRHYICWTGGYDSTFILLYYLLHTEKDVEIQPIYLGGCVDNVECNKDNESRQSREYEMMTMDKIRKMIREKFSSFYNKLLPTIVLPTIPIDNQIKEEASILYKIGHSTRPRNQYSSIAQLTKDRSIVAAVGVVGDDDHNNWRNVIIKDRDTSNARIDYDNPDMKPYRLFKNFRFPTIYFTKKEMMTVARKDGFDDILRNTWSCWFPIDGKPCGNCNMCKHRI